MIMSEEVSQRVAATIMVHLDNAANIIEVRELLSTLGFNYEIEIHAKIGARCFARQKKHSGAPAIRNEVVDMLPIIEESATHFFLRAKMGKSAGRNQSEVDAEYEKAAHLAALAAPYRHAKLTAVKLAGDPNNPVRIRDDASGDEIRAELMKHMDILIDGGLIDLEALLAERRRTKDPNKIIAAVKRGHQMLDLIH